MSNNTLNKYYVTTPIYYVNDVPHIGHAYTTIIADTLARYHRLRGDEVRFVTGTDENSQKNLQAMEKAGETDLPMYLDRMAGAWEATWHGMGLSFDDFIRTTEERHLVGVERFWNAVLASGDLEKRTYEGLYCVGCEGFKLESDLNGEGRCPLHPNKDIDRVQEENWFFKLTKYVPQLREYIKNNEGFVQPESRRNEVLGYLDAVEKGSLDVSVSREAKKLSVGIPVPGDADQRIYVWFDALLNYMTAVGYGTDEALFKKFWPVDLHLVGKDIIKFHCALWPAMIMSAAQNDALLTHEDGSPKLPHHVFAHGFFTKEGMKISKSLGNAVSPSEAAKEVGIDALRYYLLREITLGEDGDFSSVRLMDRYQNDLGNTLGNLVQRTVAMSRKYFDGKVPDVKPALSGALHTKNWSGALGFENMRKRIEGLYDFSRMDLVLTGQLWRGLDGDIPADPGFLLSVTLICANKLIEETQPFKLIKDNPEKVSHILYSLLEAIRWYAWFLTPVMPETAKKMLVALGLDPEAEYAKGWEVALMWGGLPPGTVLPEPSPLFPRLETGV